MGNVPGQAIAPNYKGLYSHESERGLRRVALLFAPACRVEGVSVNNLYTAVRAGPSNKR